MKKIKKFRIKVLTFKPLPTLRLDQEREDMDMLDIINFEKDYNRDTDGKLIDEYQKAYEHYVSACDRYDKLVTAYRVLKGISENRSAENELGEKVDSFPYTDRIMRQMIDDAQIEKDVIANHARECIKHLRSLRYKM